MTKKGKKSLSKEITFLKIIEQKLYNNWHCSKHLYAGKIVTYYSQSLPGLRLRFLKYYKPDLERAKIEGLNV